MQTQLTRSVGPIPQPRSDVGRLVRSLLAVATIVVVLAAAPARAEDLPQGMIKVRLGSDLVEGQPIFWSQREVALLSRDGGLVTFRPSAVRDYTRSAPRFFSYNASEMRARLYNEFGREFETSETPHYLVVHPKGQRQNWAKRFEDLYTTFSHYFRIRGQKLQQPRYPLVAVVFHNKKEYFDHAERVGDKLHPNYVGHYSRGSNRIFLFDMSAENPAYDWSVNAPTIVHEASHQVAFNTGVHSRFGGTPSWVAEGLATMFEASGIWHSTSSQKERLNRGRLGDFRRYVGKRPDDSLYDLIGSDRRFRTDPLSAYAEAWAFSFYLCETMPRKYTSYLALTAEREDFVEYSEKDRLADFESVFGSERRMIDRQFLRFVDRLPR